MVDCQTVGVLSDAITDHDDEWDVTYLRGGVMLDLELRSWAGCGGLSWAIGVDSCHY